MYYKPIMIKWCEEVFRSFLLSLYLSRLVYAFIHERRNGWVWKKISFLNIAIAMLPIQTEWKGRRFFFGNDMKSLFPSQIFLLFSQSLPFGVCHFNTFIRNEIFLHSHLCRLLVNILHNNTYFHTICLFHIFKREG